METNYSDRVQPVQPVEQIRMLVKSYPKQEDSKKRKREERSMLSFKELLEKLKGHDYKIIVRPHPQHVRHGKERFEQLKNALFLIIIPSLKYLKSRLIQPAKAFE